MDLEELPLKTRVIELAAEDQKAAAHILENLSVGAHAHTLSRLVLDTVPVTIGAKLAIVPDWVPIELLDAYAHTWVPPQGAPESFDEGERPIDRLVDFLETHLRSDLRAVVVCEDAIADRATIATWATRESKVTCFGDTEVYHVVASGAPKVAIEAAVRESQSHWGTGVCSVCNELPAGDIPSESFLKALVERASLVFFPAFDSDGFLLWSPRAPESTEISGQ